MVGRGGLEPLTSTSLIIRIFEMIAKNKISTDVPTGFIYWWTFYAIDHTIFFFMACYDHHPYSLLASFHKYSDMKIQLLYDKIYAYFQNLQQNFCIKNPYWSLREPFIDKADWLKIV